MVGNRRLQVSQFRFWLCKGRSAAFQRPAKLPRLFHALKPERTGRSVTDAASSLTSDGCAL